MNAASLLSAGVLTASIALTAAADESATRHALQQSGVGLGVYEGAGCAGVKSLRGFEEWFGGKPDQVVDFVSWQVLQDGTTWGMRCWAQAGQKNVIYSVPMLPPGHWATLAEGAAGRFDDLFTRYATSLVKYGFGNSIIRIGWEFNGDWYAWKAAQDPKSWIEYFRRIVRTMRAVPGANFMFDWNPAASGQFRPEDAYPGDDYVDIIGLDFYNVIGDRTPMTPQVRWDKRLNGPTGLIWHRDFARAHHKPMSYPEWGTGLKPDGRGGADDPYYIEQMAHWIKSNEVVYHNYWDYPAPDYNAKLSDLHQPDSAAAFKRVFGAKRGAQ